MQDVDDFEDPKIQLEQYMTTPHIAAHALHTIESRFGDIDGKLIADLGCGCGMLTIGSVMLGASFCVGVDIDSDALAVCQHNLVEMEITNVDLIRMDVEEQLAAGENHRWKGLFDCVIMNPPFGTKGNEGIDTNFLRFALQISRTAVYSMHKTSTREHFKKLADSLGVEIELVAQLRYDLSRTYRRHQQESVDIEVDLFRFAHVRPGEIPRLHDMAMVLRVCATTKDSSRTDRKNQRRGKSSRKH